MAGVKGSLAIGFTVVALAVGGAELLQPTTPDEARRQQHDQKVEDLSDSQEQENDRRRDRSRDDADADRRDRLRPGEHRPPERPRIRLRLP